MNWTTRFASALLAFALMLAVPSTAAAQGVTLAAAAGPGLSETGVGLGLAVRVDGAVVDRFGLQAGAAVFRFVSLPGRRVHALFIPEAGLFVRVGSAVHVAMGAGYAAGNGPDLGTGLLFIASGATFPAGPVWSVRPEARLRTNIGFPRGAIGEVSIGVRYRFGR